MNVRTNGRQTQSGSIFWHIFWRVNLSNHQGFNGVLIYVFKACFNLIPCLFFHLRGHESENMKLFYTFAMQDKRDWRFVSAKYFKWLFKILCISFKQTLLLYLTTALKTKICHCYCQHSCCRFTSHRHKCIQTSRDPYKSESLQIILKWMFKCNDFYFLIIMHEVQNIKNIKKSSHNNLGMHSLASISFGFIIFRFIQTTFKNVSGIICRFHLFWST